MVLRDVYRVQRCLVTRVECERVDMVPPNAYVPNSEGTRDSCGYTLLVVIRRGVSKFIRILPVEKNDQKPVDASHNTTIKRAFFTASIVDDSRRLEPARIAAHPVSRVSVPPPGPWPHPTGLRPGGRAGVSRTGTRECSRPCLRLSPSSRCDL